MYLVKALTAAKGKIRFDKDVVWASGQYGLVNDAVITKYQNESTAFTVIAGPDFKDCLLGLSGLTSDGNGTIPTATAALGVTMADSNSCGGGLHRTVLTLTAVTIDMTDATDSHGSLQLFDFPEGLILTLGASSDLAIVSNAVGLDADAELVGAVGTVTTQTDNATLTTTEADLIPSTVCTLTASAGAMAGKSVTTGDAVFDGTGTAKDAFLNFAAPDADTDDDDVLTVTGTITLVWINLGDNG